MKRLVRANSDKPHRCPECHGIPQVLWWRVWAR